jgi:hypothetical protein
MSERDFLEAGSSIESPVEAQRDARRTLPSR